VPELWGTGRFSVQQKQAKDGWIADVLQAVYGGI
jgi:hypothetical protein